MTESRQSVAECRSCRSKHSPKNDVYCSICLFIVPFVCITVQSRPSRHCQRRQDIHTTPEAILVLPQSSQTEREKLKCCLIMLTESISWMIDPTRTATEMFSYGSSWKQWLLPVTNFGVWWSFATILSHARCMHTCMARQVLTDVLTPDIPLQSVPIFQSREFQYFDLTKTASLFWSDLWVCKLR